MKRYVLSMLAATVMLCPSWSASKPTRTDTFTEASFIFRDVSYNLALDHFNTALLVMLAHYHPEEFSLIDPEVEKTLAAVGGPRGKASEDRFTFREADGAVLARMLDPHMLESATAGRSLRYSIAAAGIIPYANITMREEGFEIPGDVTRAVEAFLADNGEEFYEFECAVVAVAERRIRGMLRFLARYRSFDFLPRETLNVYISLGNNLQSLRGRADDFRNASGMFYTLGSPEEDAMVFFHELSHLWLSRHHAEEEIIARLGSREDQAGGLEMLRAAARKLFSPDAERAETLRELVEAVYGQEPFGFNEFFAYFFSRYWCARYAPRSPQARGGLSRFAASDLDDAAWEHARDLFEWSVSQGLGDRLIHASHPEDVVYKEFVLFALALDRGLESALAQSEGYLK